MNDSEKIKIEVRPVRKVVIFDVLKLSVDELLNRIGLLARAGQLVPLNWSEGIVFLASSFHPECEVIVEEAMEGNEYWGSVMFAEMPKYEPIKKIGGMEIPIMDQTPSPHFRQVAQWLRKRKTSTNEVS